MILGSWLCFWESTTNLFSIILFSVQILFGCTKGEINDAGGNNINFMIFALFLFIIIAAAIQEFWIKGRFQLNPLKKNVPCDGNPSILIKVQFVDPFGKPRKQIRDRIVKISSTICGLVSLKGRSGIQKADTTINLVNNSAQLVLEIFPATAMFCDRCGAKQPT